MGDGDLQIGFDTSGVVNGVRAGEVALERFIGEVQALDKTLDKLGTSSKTSLGRMAKAMKDIDGNDRSIASAFKQAQQQMLSELTSGEQQVLKLVRMQTNALQQQYERRLAKMGQLSSQELQTWKDYGITLGGIQAKQLRDYKAGLKEEERARNESLSQQRSYLNSLVQLAKAEESIKVAATLQRAQAQVNAAMQTAGTYQVYNPKTGIAGAVRNVQREAPAVVPQIPARDLENLERTDSYFRRLSVSGNDLHSVVRGLASGFGALWLTWGNTAPLLAGAAISFSLAKSLQYGKEFESLMYSIQEIAGATTTEVEGLRKSLFEMGVSGMYGPIEAAKGLNTLMLAGLNAQEAIQSLAPTLRFAAAGDLDMQKAAEVTVAVGQAYAFTAQQYETLQDIISKTAADTMSSVTNMSEAFKTASVVAQQFNLSLIDTAEGLGGLAQIGITGTAAGTAYRNFYTEITKQGGKVSAALKDLKVEIRETAGAGGELKPTLEIFRQLSLALVNKTKAAQDAYFADLSNERGAKEFAASQAKALETMKRMSPELLAQADNLERTGNKSEAAALRIKAVNIAFDEMARKSREAVANAAGFNFMASLEKQFTPEGQIKSLKAALETDLIRAFQGVSDSVYVLGTALHEVLVSDTFKNALASMVKGVVDLISTMVDAAKFLWEHKEAVAALTAAYVLLGSSAVAGAAASGIGMVTTAVKAFFAEMAVGTTFLGAMRSGIVALTLSAELAAPAITGMLATGAIAAAGTGLAVLIATVVAGTAAVAALAAKWLFMGENAEEAARKARDAQIASLTDSSKALKAKMTMFDQSVQDEIKASEITLKARREGATEEQARDKVYAQTAINRVEEYYEQLKVLERLIAKKSELYYISNEMYTPENAAIVAEVELEKRLGQLEKEKLSAVAKVVVDTNRLLQLKKQIQSYDLAASKAARQSVTGSDSRTVAEEEKTRKVQVAAFVLHNDNLLKELEKRHKAELTSLKQKESDAIEILNAQRDAELISEGTHFGKLLNLTRQYEDNKLAAIEQARSAYNAEYLSDRLNMVMELENWKAANPAASAEQVEAAVAKLKTALDNLKNTADTAFEGFNNEAAAAAGVTDKLLAKAVVASDKSLKALRKSSEDFWKTEEQGRAKAQAAADLAETLAYYDPRYAAYVSAATEAQTRLNDEYARLAPELALAEAALADFAKTQGPLELLVGDAAQQVGNLSEKVQLLRTQMDALKSGRGTDEAGQAAVVAFDRAEQKKLVSGLADAVEAGLYEGGKAGRTKLRDLIVAELKKPIRIVLEAGIKAMLGGTGSTVKNVGDLLGNAVTGGISSMVGSAGAAFGVEALTSFTAGMKGATLAPGLMGPTTAGAGGAMGAGAAFAQAAPWVLGAMVVMKGLSRTLKDTGIQGSFGGEGFTGESYKFYKGGFLSSNKTTTEALTAPLESLLDSSYVAIRDNTKKMAQELGLSASAVDTFTSSIKVSFTGLTEDQIQEKLQEEFGKVGDSMAELVLGAGKTAKDLEDLYNAVMQQRYDLETKLLELQGNTVELRRRERDALHETNRAIYDQIKALEDQQSALSNLTTSFESAGSASALLAKYGGTGSAKSTLASLNSSYRFLTSIADKTEVLGQIAELEASLAAEVNQTKIEAMSKELDMAKQMLEAAKGIKNYLDGLKLGSLSTLSPEQMLQEASSQYQSTLLKAKSGDADSAAALQGVADAYLQQAQSYYGSNTNYAGIFSTVTSQLETFSDRTIAAYDPMVTKLEKQISLLQKQTGISQATLDKMKELDALAQDQFAADLRAAAEQAIGFDNIATALKGLPPALAAAMSSAIADSLTPVFTSLATKLTANTGVSLSSGTVSGAVSSASSGATTVAQSKTAILKSGISQLATGSYGVTEKAQFYVNAKNAGYSEDDIVAAAKSVTSVTDAELSYLKTAAGIQDIYNNVLGRTADEGGIQYWANQIKSGTLNTSNILDAMVAAANISEPNSVKTSLLTSYVPKFAAGGSYEGGMALVGEEGPELINFRNPGQVYTANQTAAILGGDKETAALLKELLAELRSLRSQQGNENSAQVTRLTGIERKLASIESTGVLEKAR